MHVHFGFAQAGYSAIPSHYATPGTVARPDSVYRLPSFEYGKVTFATGFSPVEQPRFNYNLFTGQMDMINDKGDTVQVKEIKELKFISLADCLFFHSYYVGYVEILHQSTVMLGVLNRRTAAYPIGGGSYLQQVNGTESRQYFQNQSSYYFVESNRKLYRATSSSIKTLFHDHRKAVKTYLNENTVDFERKEDLIKLLSFCSQLKSQTDKKAQQ